jgi:hypothetical protein
MAIPLAKLGESIYDGEGMDGWLRVKGMMRMRRWIPADDLRG